MDFELVSKQNSFELHLELARKTMSPALASVIRLVVYKFQNTIQNTNTQIRAFMYEYTIMYMYCACVNRLFS